MTGEMQSSQRCSSTEPYFVQLIPSRTQPNLVYEVHSVLLDDTPEEYTCGCPAFIYTGKCAHQRMAWEDRCLWTEEEGPEEQTQDERYDGRCPRCGQQTVKDFELDDRD